ncbi:MAG: hypothetical protein IKM63_04240 [Firmicutes bacterium]|nr:hypothetical protein [Bacillota bacterium]
MYKKKERRRNLTTAILSLSLLTVMPLLSMALYLAQFTTPMILSIIGSSTPYFVASCSALIFVVWSYLIKIPKAGKEAVIQEK